MLLDLIMGTYQEWKAESSANSLKKLIKVKTKVLPTYVVNEKVDINNAHHHVGIIVVMWKQRH